MTSDPLEIVLAVAHVMNNAPLSWQRDDVIYTK